MSEYEEREITTDGASLLRRLRQDLPAVPLDQRGQIINAWEDLLDMLHGPHVPIRGRFATEAQRGRAKLRGIFLRAAYPETAADLPPELLAGLREAAADMTPEVRERIRRDLEAIFA